MYENIFTQINPLWGNREVYTNTPEIEIGLDYPNPSNLEVYMLRSRTGKPFMVGVATGRFTVIQSFVYLQIIGNYGTTGYAYVKMLYVDQKRGNVAGKASDSTAQGVINGIIANNKIIYENNLLCAGILKALDKKGIKVDNAHRQKLAGLQNKLIERNERISKSKLLKIQQVAHPAGFSRYADDLKNFMNHPFNEFGHVGHIGIAPIVAGIVIGAIIMALLGWIAYLIFKPDYTDSKADLKVSKELTALLANTDPETKQKILNDLEGQVDKAYVQGKMDGSGMGMLKTAGLAAAGLLGFVAISNLNAHLPKKK